ncbi:PP2C family protein-serine/threonine phosphatase [Mycobacterium terramassiliense]|uniref:Serine/threonine protein phosphatase n=1 Tax=Mycobacterium terramassiliense TaxID=1841859 RepID=A0A2U3NK11_9MYCO|nr:GAF domain-containing SpoIIE family protein phosphatase [Mycobacterium terramassiliense]SPM31877.1 serine/threonine protein phosphatase [Mycobacterium terramassiliense]
MRVIQTSARQTTTKAAASSAALSVRDRDQLVEKVAHGLAGSLNLRRTALRLLTSIRPQLADWSVAILPDIQTGGLLLVGGDDAGFHAVVSQRSIDFEGLGRVLRTGRTELAHVALGTDAEASLTAMIPHPRLVQEAATLQPADVLGVGLTARGTTFGALVMVRGDGRRPFDEDLELIQRVAERAALALDSARLYEERARIAAVIQESLRPPSLPRIDGVRMAARYRPAAEQLDIGGDFYDAHGDDGDWVLCLGDVCGKGVAAAALNGRARQSIRTAAHFDRRPEVVLGALNSVLCDEATSQLVTVVCARMRPAGGGRLRMDVASAGHPKPIVLRADGRVEEVEVGGTAAGMVARVAYTAVTIQLDGGDTMLMFTDGIDEAFGADGQYGVERLLALLPPYAGAGPEVICEVVEQHVIEHLDGRAHDDMALFAVTCGS